MLKRFGDDLSGGQQRQLANSRALVMRPKLLLLDEPTEGIQPSIIKDVERVIVLVELYFDFARRLADLVLHVGADLDVMERDTRLARGARPYVFTNLSRMRGLETVELFIRGAAESPCSVL